MWPNLINTFILPSWCVELVNHSLHCQYFVSQEQRPLVFSPFILLIGMHNASSPKYLSVIHIKKWSPQSLFPSLFLLVVEQQCKNEKSVWLNLKICAWVKKGELEEVGFVCSSENGKVFVHPFWGSSFSEQVRECNGCNLLKERQVTPRWHQPETVCVPSTNSWIKKRGECMCCLASTDRAARNLILYSKDSCGLLSVAAM